MTINEIEIGEKYWVRFGDGPCKAKCLYKYGNNLIFRIKVHWCLSFVEELATERIIGPITLKSQKEKDSLISQAD